MIYWFIIVVVISIVLVFNLDKLRRKTTLELRKILYLDHNVALYISLLNNNRLRSIYTNATIEILKLDAWIFQNDDNKIEESFKNLSHFYLTQNQKIDIATRKISYYCSINDKDNALEALEDIKKLAKNKKKLHNLVEESSLIVDIYIHHDISRKDDLLIMEKEDQDKNRKGLTNFRLAKLEYYQNKNNEVDYYLKRAIVFLQDEKWIEIAKQCSDNHSLLAKY